MKSGWGLGVLALTMGFLAVSVAKADVSAASTPVSSAKKANGWTAKSSGKTFMKAPASRQTKQAAQPSYKYICPMGEYTGDKPGKCPKCGMELKKVLVEPVKKAAPAKK